MLSPDEFTVGTFANAAPLSLILPRSSYEETALIGSIDGAAAAVILSGRFAFHFFESANNHDWRGLIVPDVRVEIDETTLFDPDQNDIPLGTVIRTDTRLVIQAKRENSFSRGVPITLRDELPRPKSSKPVFVVGKLSLENGRLNESSGDHQAIAALPQCHK
ncbi:hypothetical protein [Phyllobacterium calauticae]|jgi:hypothetical protein|uniref:hypothetical protein n=1 Tax=Phyllobacterium calauticae TaxID=2817027 RepID=UPI001CBF1E82|nr:hypothetical protein [Phyllobacterium calauticae]